MKIIVLGRGLVPRIGGIAPLKEPFEVTDKILTLIINQPGLKPYLVKEDGTKTEITHQNYKKIIEASKKPAQPKKIEPVKAAPVVKPVEAPKVEVKKEQPKVEVKNYEKKELPKVEQPKVEKPKQEEVSVEEDFGDTPKKEMKFKPVINEEK